MRWPWTAPPDPRSAKAKADAEAQLRDAHARWPAVRQVTGSLRQMRLENHWAERVAQALRGPQ